MGRDKGSLTEQQTKGNSNNNDTDKEKTQHKPYNPESSSPRPPPYAPEPQVSSPVWPGGVSSAPPSCAPSWIQVKINPVLAEPRTISQLCT